MSINTYFQTYHIPYTMIYHEYCWLMIDLNHLTHPFSPFRWVELLLRIFGAKQELRGMFRVASEPQQRGSTLWDWDRSSIFDIRWIYPLVNIQRAIENHHAINGKINYKWPFSIAFCMFTRGYLGTFFLHWILVITSGKIAWKCRY